VFFSLYFYPISRTIIGPVFHFNLIDSTNLLLHNIGSANRPVSIALWGALLRFTLCVVHTRWESIVIS
jgi:hypothetical protein